MRPAARTTWVMWAMFCALCFVPAGLDDATAQELTPGERPPRDRSHDLCVALILPLDKGPLKDLSTQLMVVAEMAAIESYLRVKIYDSGKEDEDAVEALQKAYEDPEVIAVIGPLGLTSSRKVAAALHSAPVPTFTLNSDASLDDLHPYMRRVRPSPQAYARAMAREAYTTQNVRRVAILVPDHDYGKQAALAFGQTFTELGGELASVVPYDPESKDLRKPLKAIAGQLAYVGKRRKVGTRRASKEGYIRNSGRKTIDFDALFIPDFHPTVAKLLPLLPIAGMQSGAGEGKGKAVTLLGMPSWHGSSMRVTEAHAAGALYFDPFGGAHSGGVAEEFVLLFESETGRTPVDLEAELFDIVNLIGSITRRATRKPGVALDPEKRRAYLLESLPSPKAPWYGVCGGWAYREDGALERTFTLFEFDVDGEVIPLD